MKREDCPLAAASAELESVAEEPEEESSAVCSVAIEEEHDAMSRISIKEMPSRASRTGTAVTCATAGTMSTAAAKDKYYKKGDIKVKQLPWTEEETQQVMEHIRFLQDELPGGRGLNNSESAKVWKDSLDHLRSKIVKAVAEGKISRHSSLLHKLASATRAIQLVDLTKLSKLMKANSQAGDCIAGKEVLLLCGETGAGKTTALQYFLGTTFEEVEVDGFLHLSPTSYVDPAHDKFKTSYSREPTTRVLQAATEWVDGHGEIAIADLPSYDVANCLEEDIALGTGMVNALYRAKSVRPVVLLSREGMGNRFSNLPETMRIIRRLYQVQSEKDWKPFCYAFTKYDYKHRKLLHKQFAALQRLPPKLGKGEQPLFNALIEDIAEKTNPEANVILPMEENPSKSLAYLFRATEDGKMDPKELCTSFASDFSLRQFHLQMQLAMCDFQGNMLQEDYESAIKNINNMKTMADVFPEISTHLESAKDAFKQRVAQLWVLVVRSIGQEDYETALYRMEQLNAVGSDFPDAMECSVLGHELLTQSITEPFTEHEFDKSIHRIIEMTKLQKRFPDLSDVVDFGLQALREKLINLINDKDYSAAVVLMHHLGRSESDLPSSFVVAQHGLHLVRESLLKLIEDEDYGNGIPLTIKVSELGSAFAEANSYVRRILKTIRKRVDYAIQSRDYVKAGFLLRTVTTLAPSLTDGKEYIEFALDSAAQHVCELRMEVVNAFDALLQVKDQTKYKKLLQYAVKTMASLNKSEPTRLVCADFYKTQEIPLDAENYKPNYLAILCTPRDCTSESFCVAQVRHLIEQMTSELAPFDEKASMEFLMENRKDLLSIILRLRSTSNGFMNSAGGSLAVTLYEKAFTKFQDVVENILSLSEKSFNSSMDMKEFEFQAWLLAFLIQGFTREREDEDGPDIQKMEDLDHRRVTLMLRFENEISDTMELLSNYTFPDFKEKESCKPNFATFLQEVNLPDLEAPRQLLLSLSQAPQLCKMMATMISAHSAEKSVESLDRSIIDLFGRIVSYLEATYVRLIQDLKIKNITSHVGLKDASEMNFEIPMIYLSFQRVEHWSKDTTTGIAPLLKRLCEIEACLHILIPKLKERVHGAEDIGPAAFIKNLICMENSGPVGCNCLFSKCDGSVDDFMETLPVLPPRDQEHEIASDKVKDQDRGNSIASTSQVRDNIQVRKSEDVHDTRDDEVAMLTEDRNEAVPTHKQEAEAATRDHPLGSSGSDNMNDAQGDTKIRKDKNEFDDSSENSITDEDEAKAAKGTVEEAIAKTLAGGPTKINDNPEKPMTTTLIEYALGRQQKQ